MGSVAIISLVYYTSVKNNLHNSHIFFCVNSKNEKHILALVRNTRDLTNPTHYIRDGTL